MKRVAAALLVLVVTASVAPAQVAGGPVPTGVAGGVAPADRATATAGTGGQFSETIATQPAGNTTPRTSGNASRTYAGTYVSFDVDERAVTDYAVRGEEMFDSVRVASEQSVARGDRVGLGDGLAAVTEVEGAGLDRSATTRTEVTVAAETGATLAAHDNPRGLLVVAGSDESYQSNQSNQSNYVVADLAAGANATADGDSQVEVTTENGTEGTLLVVGAGDATVTDDGDVTARLDGGLLVFRAYPDGKGDRDEKQEALIAEGTATAEAYVMVENTTTVVDTVSYGANTSVETAETGVGAVTFAVERTTDEGTVLLTSVSERAFAAADLDVAVDGETAAEARTYTQLKSAIGSDRSRYVVERAGDARSASADASADVLVAVTHFSERTVSIASESASDESSSGTTGDDGESGDGSSDDATGDDPTDGGQDADASNGGTATTTVADDETDDGVGVPGFTASAALLALVAAAMLARLR